MTSTRFHACAACAVALLMLAIAFTPQVRAQVEPFARMEVRGNPGDKAYVEQQLLPPLAKNVPLQDGHLISTGANTGALVTMPESQIVLDENSAKLISYSFFKGARCYAARLRSGRMLIDGSKVCFMTEDIPLGAYSHSLINVRYTSEGVEVTVIKGSAEVELPVPMHVTENEQLVVRPDGSYYRNKLKHKDAKRTADWAKQYVEGSSSAGKSLLKGLGIAVVLYVACRLLGECDGDDDDHGSSPAPPAAPSEPEPVDYVPPPLPPPSSDTVPPSPDAQLPAGEVLQQSPVYVPPQLGPCCIGGLNGTTEQLTPAQCKAKGGDQGVCTIIR